MKIYLFLILMVVLVLSSCGKKSEISDSEESNSNTNNTDLNLPTIIMSLEPKNYDSNNMVVGQNLQFNIHALLDGNVNNDFYFYKMESDGGQNFCEIPSINSTVSINSGVTCTSSAVNNYQLKFTTYAKNKSGTKSISSSFIYNFNIKANENSTVSPTIVLGSSNVALSGYFNIGDINGIKSVTLDNMNVMNGPQFHVESETSTQKTYKYYWSSPEAGNHPLEITVADKLGAITNLKIIFLIAEPGDPSMSPNSIDGIENSRFEQEYTITNPNSINSITPDNLPSGSTFTFVSETDDNKEKTYRLVWPSPTVGSRLLKIKVTDNFSEKSAQTILNISPQIDSTISPAQVLGTIGKPLEVIYTVTDPNGIKSVTPIELSADASFVLINETSDYTQRTYKYTCLLPIAMYPGVFHIEVVDLADVTKEIGINYYIIPEVDSTVSPLSVNGTAGSQLRVDFTIDDPNNIKSVIATNLPAGATFEKTGGQLTHQIFTLTWPSPTEMNGTLHLDVTDDAEDIKGVDVAFTIDAQIESTISPGQVLGAVGIPLEVIYTVTDPNGIKSVTPYPLASGATFTLVGGTDTQKTYRYFWPSPTYMYPGVLYMNVVDNAGVSTEFNIDYIIIPEGPSSVSPLTLSGTAGSRLNVNFIVTDDNKVRSVTPTNLPSGATFRKTGGQFTYQIFTLTWPSPTEMNDTLHLDVTDEAGVVTGFDVALSIAPQVESTLSPGQVLGAVGIPLEVIYTVADPNGIKSVTPYPLAPDATFTLIDGTDTQKTYRYYWPSPTYMFPGVLHMDITDKTNVTTSFNIDYIIIPEGPSSVNPLSVSGTAGSRLNVNFTVTDNNKVKSVVPTNLPAGATFRKTGGQGTMQIFTLNWPSPTIMNGTLHLDVTDEAGVVTGFDINLIIN